MKSRTQLLQSWAAEQNAFSWGILSIGSFSIILLMVGSFAILVGQGPTPYQSLLRTMTSDSQTAILLIAGLIGLGAAILGFGLYRRMATKASRETTISGAVLGVLTVIFALIYQFFRTGDKFDLFVRQNFSFDLLKGTSDDFLLGARNTVLLALSGEAIGIGLGLVFALMILSKRIVVRAPARTYINFFRGTPLLWQITFFYFGIVLGTRLGLSTFVSAMVTLGLNAGAYTAEVFRAGIQSIERGQMEGARSLGMSYLQAMVYVILPQAVRRVIPPLTNEFVILIKDTSLVAFLGLFPEDRELFSVGRDFYSELANSTPYVATAAGYMIVTLPMIRVVTWLEKKLRSGLTGVVG